jgi:hypothetical protein
MKGVIFSILYRLYKMIYQFLNFVHRPKYNKDIMPTFFSHKHVMLQKQRYFQVLSVTKL